MRAQQVRHKPKYGSWAQAPYTQDMGRAQGKTATRGFDAIMGKRRGLLEPTLHRSDARALRAIADAESALSSGDTVPAVDLLSSLQRGRPLSPAGHELVGALSRHYVEDIVRHRDPARYDELMLSQAVFRTILGEDTDKGPPMLDKEALTQDASGHLAEALIDDPRTLTARGALAEAWLHHCLVDAVALHIRSRGIGPLRKALTTDQGKWRKAVVSAASAGLTPQEIDQKRVEAVTSEVIEHVFSEAKEIIKVIPLPQLLLLSDGRLFLKQAFINAGVAAISGERYRSPDSSKLLAWATPQKRP